MSLCVLCADGGCGGQRQDEGAQVAGFVECVGDLDPDLDDLADRQLAVPEDVRERVAGDVFHGEERAPFVGIPRFVDHGHVGMGERGCGGGLAEKSLFAAGIAGAGVGKDLEGDVAAQPRIVGNAERRANLIPPDAGPRSKTHRDVARLYLDCGSLEGV